MNSEKYSEQFTADSWRDTPLKLGSRIAGPALRWYKEEKERTQLERFQVEVKPNIAYSPSEEGNAVIVVRVGFRQDQQLVMERLAPSFTHLGPAYFMKSSPSDDDNKAAILTIIEQQPDRDIVFVGISKGGKDLLHELTDPEFREEVVRVKAIDFDSTPFLRSHIRPVGRVALWGGQQMPITHTLAKVYHENSGTATKPEDTISVRGSSPLRFYSDMAEIPALRRPFHDNDSVAAALDPSFVENVVMVSSHYDAVVKTQKSHKWLVQTSARHIPLEIDFYRKHKNHAGITDNPSMQIRLLERLLNAESTDRLLTHS